MAEFVADVPTHVIDLRAAESKRWAQVIAAEKPIATAIVQEASAMFERVPEMLRWVFARLYQSKGGLYHGEIASWSEALGVSLGTVTMLNCAYELSHLHMPKIFGCTAGVRWAEGLGMIHVRSLDWPLATMGAATRLFRFQSGPREFVSVGVPGQVGVLSGMVPGGYSVTINWAPPSAFPTFDYGPTFLLREVLETCDTYAAAMDRLTKTQLSTSVFFTVCGIEKGQACVVERTQHQSAVRPLTGPVEVQANHHIAKSFTKHNAAIVNVPEGEGVFSLEGSGRRVDILNRSLAEMATPCTFESAVQSLGIPTVLNKDTCQQMVFCPSRGEVHVWRRNAP